MNIKYLLFIATISIGIMACGSDEAEEETMVEECVTEGVTYNNDIAAILDSNCATTSCHNDTDLANGFSLDGFTKSSAAAQFNNFLPSINRESGFSPMPRGRDKLDQCDIDKITAWIDAGFPE